MDALRLLVQPLVLGAWQHCRDCPQTFFLTAHFLDWLIFFLFALFLAHTCAVLRANYFLRTIPLIPPSTCASSRAPAPPLHPSSTFAPIPFHPPSHLHPFILTPKSLSDLHLSPDFLLFRMAALSRIRNDNAHAHASSASGCEGPVCPLYSFDFVVGARIVDADAGSVRSICAPIPPARAKGLVAGTATACVLCPFPGEYARRRRPPRAKPPILARDLGDPGASEIDGPTERNDSSCRGPQLHALVRVRISRGLDALGRAHASSSSGARLVVVRPPHQAECRPSRAEYGYAYAYARYTVSRVRQVAPSDPPAHEQHRSLSPLLLFSHPIPFFPFFPRLPPPSLLRNVAASLR
ncbi:hypothetical protein B0H16DRAFT_1778630 [Mycena metata]|uniref:Uncharacterized protein n=1 Tax=Mycena metata TaxID=1033252 RepID=A0AAD7MQH6_9AGAR|nr:hypothetical protein B0H16DRAFT_1778630 [Mycena metata]